MTAELDFTIAEYNKRIENIRAKMAEKGLDAFIVLGAENIHYVCGYDGGWTAPIGEFSGVIIPMKKDPTILVRSLESKTVKKQSLKDQQVYIDGEGPWKKLKGILEAAKVAKGKIGVEDNKITLRRLNGLKNTVPQAEIIGVAGLVESVMAVPSKKELQYTRKAGEITQVGYEKAVNTIKVGVPYSEIIAQSNLAMYRAGMTEQMVSGLYILNCVWGGPTGGAMHETDVTMKVAIGDLITPEIWGTYKHYVAANQCTVYVGKRPKKEFVDLYNVLAEMYVATREAMKPGNTVGEAWEAGSKIYKKHYGVDYYRMLGPQMGAGFVGRLDKGVKLPLCPGAAYICQPQVNDPLLMCVAATIMITEKGNEEITQPLLELKCIG